MDRRNFVIIFLSFITIVLYLIKVYLAADAGIITVEYAEDLKIISKLKVENLLLRQEILYRTSLQSINAQAIQNGFIPAVFYYP